MSERDDKDKVTGFRCRDTYPKNSIFPSSPTSLTTKESFELFRQLEVPSWSEIQNEISEKSPEREGMYNSRRINDQDYYVDFSYKSESGINKSLKGSSSTPLLSSPSKSNNRKKMKPSIEKQQQLPDGIYLSPSDRIAIHYTPKSSWLTMKSIERKLNERLQKRPLILTNSASLSTLQSQLPVSPSALKQRNNNEPLLKSEKYLNWNPRPESTIEFSKKNQEFSVNKLDSRAIQIDEEMKTKVISSYVKVLSVIADEDFLPPVTRSWEARLVSRMIDTRYFKKNLLTHTQKRLLSAVLKEISVDFHNSIRKSILNYDLKSLDQRDHHGVDVVALSNVQDSLYKLNRDGITDCVYPHMKQRKEWIFSNLFAIEYVLRNLWAVWEDANTGYGKMILTDLSEHDFKSQLPLPFEQFQNLLEAQVSYRTGKLKEAWYPTSIALMDKFVKEIEDPIKALAEERTKAKLNEGIHKVSPSDPNFHKWMLNVKIPSHTYTGPMHGIGNRRANKILEEKKYIINQRHRIKGIYRVSAALMSGQLCKLVYSSITGFVDFFEQYSEKSKDYNHHENEDNDKGNNNGLKDFAHPAFVIKLVVIHPVGGDKSLPKFEFDPPFDVLKDKLMSSLKAITEASLGMSRLEIAVEELPHNKGNPFGIMKTMKSKEFNPLEGVEEEQNNDGDHVSINKNHIKGVSHEDKVVRHARSRLNDVISYNRIVPETFLKSFDKYLFLYGVEEEKRIQNLAAVEGGPSASIELFEREINRLVACRESIYNHCQDIEVFVMVELHSYAFKSELAARCNDLIKMRLSLFMKELYLHIADLDTRYEEMCETLSSTPKITEELCKLREFYNEAPNLIRSMELEFHAIGGVKDRQIFAISNGSQPSEPQINKFSSVYNWQKKIRKYLLKCQNTLVDGNAKFIEQLEFRKTIYTGTLRVLQGNVKSIFNLSGKGADDIVRAAAEIDRIKREHLDNMFEADGINNQEKMLQQNRTDYDTILSEVERSIEPFEKLYEGVVDYVNERKTWYELPLRLADAETAERTADGFKRNMNRMAKDLSGNKAPQSTALEIKDECDSFLKSHLPLMRLIANPGLRERHWDEMSNIIGFHIEHNEDTSLTDLISQNIHLYVADIEEVCVNASKEAAIERTLKQMKLDWKDVQCILKDHKLTGTYIITGGCVDEVQSLLDDQLVKAQSMQSSRYALPFLSEIKGWVHDLTCVQDVFDALLKVQVSWLYLEPIFSSADIKHQMPVESQRFDEVDATWRETMNECKTLIYVMPFTAVENLLRRLAHAKVLLDQIQKGLNDYLETKRLFFPRFFFLSNDELLEILSETKDPLRVQPHLKKCFEGIHKLQFTDNLDIVAMFSSKGEKVDFTFALGEPNINPKDSKGNVEVWLLQVEQQMRKACARIIDEAMEEYLTQSRTAWVQSRAGQAVLTVSQSMWTKEVEEAIETGGADGISNYANKCTKQLLDIVEMVRGELPDLVRETLGALVVLDVHARDVTNLLAAEKVNRISDFSWSSQMRYYWSDNRISATTGEVGSMYVRMINARIAYAFEYLGTQGRLVITPLTDRCYRTLMGALHLNLGGAPEGPAGTGKTETVKDLSKSTGMMCVVFNCSDGLDYLAMAKFFKGLASSGAWACFDEFNRIELEVLSVIAQQILEIQKAKIENAKVLLFEGTKLKFKSTCNAFITMNPGYAGRSELPDNLKVLFRTVAMMVPDYAMIAEIMLYSYGYEFAKPLAIKIVATYKLCSEQLSSQDHYDYGMRAVMAVLRAAGNLKREEGNVEEEILMLRAIVDVNVPKFLSHDIPLFGGIVGDLFPGVTLPTPDRDLLINEIHDACRSFNLQVTESFLVKILQIYEMMIVRHGFMVVGEPWSGKSSALKVLAGSLSALLVSNPEDKKWSGVISISINPKSISMGELYGNFDQVTHEWFDGILPRKFRDFSADKIGLPRDRKWLIFDGPVDAIWIENMNTVLDDNKKLCLMSGEIIPMTDKMSMIFEPMDLAVASPATVSRCGMIYMEPKNVGYVSLVESWCNHFADNNTFYPYRKGISFKIKNSEKEEEPNIDDEREERSRLNKEDKRSFTLTPSMITYLKSLFEWIVPPTLLYIYSKLTQMVPMSEGTLIRNLLVLFECQIETMQNNDKNLSFLAADIEGLFIYSIVWTLGCALDDDHKISFSEYLLSFVSDITYIERHDIYPALLSKGWSNPKRDLYVPLPPLKENETIYDYMYSVPSTLSAWVAWKDTLPLCAFPLHANFHEIIVPTQNTLQFDFVVRTLLLSGRSSLICGPTGTGKSAYLKNFLLNQLSKDTHHPSIFVNFSARTSASQTQNIIDGRMDKRRKGVYGPPPGKKQIIFIDDLNMPEKDAYGAQPPIELLRQGIDSQGWYDVKEGYFRFIEDTTMVCAMQPGGNTVTPRFLRHLNTFCFQSMGVVVLKRIFTELMNWYTDKNHYEPAICKTGIEAVQATLLVYNNAVQTLRPTPSKSHYKFNLRDFAAVIQGMTLIAPNELYSSERLVRLWIHETLRVFYDRLVDVADRDWFFQTLKELTQQCFHKGFDSLLSSLPEKGGAVQREDLRKLFFGAYSCDPNNVTVGSKNYTELEVATLPASMKVYLNEYNSENKKQLDMVMFLYAVEHISRACRVFQMPGGNCLFVGVGGSGRQCATRLAAYISDCMFKTIEISKSYGTIEWHDDVKAILTEAGTGTRSVCFFFSDSQIKWEGMVEDMSNLLNSGEIPNLFNAEEKGAICEKVSVLARVAGKGRDLTTTELFAYFITRAKSNLHISLSFSPIGSTFRERLRKFPSLVNCCTINWFEAWPQDALEAVASAFLDKVADLNNTLRQNIKNQCVYFHESTRALSVKYLTEAGRYNYVTPTSFLEMLKGFEKLLSAKRVDNTSVKERYSTGLRKLQFATDQVNAMQIELETLQPELVRSKADTGALMERIKAKMPGVEEKREKMRIETDAAMKDAEAVAAVKKECEDALGLALPVLESALAALDTLTTADIAQVKAMANPPKGVRIVMEAVCVMLAIPPDRVKDPEGGLLMIKDYWPASKRLLGDPKFLDRLRFYDKDNIEIHILTELRHRFIGNEDFNPIRIRQASNAAEGMCRWVIAMETYSKVVVEIRPKREALAKAEIELAEKMAGLNAKKEQLHLIEADLKLIEDDFAAADKKRSEIENSVNLCGTKLVRAEQLIAGLGGERSRWRKEVDSLSVSFTNLTGDILVSSGVIAYLGTFTPIYRNKIMGEWVKNSKSTSIPTSASFSLETILGDAIQTRQWLIDGLPSDSFSISNGIIVNSTRRWPLLIDPQGQANKWIKNMEKKNLLRICKQSDGNFLQTLENSVQYGNPVLLENVGEELDPSLEPLLLKQTFKSGGVLSIRLGDATIEFSESFKLYITTKLRNPHYKPEVSTRVTLVNFMITSAGLEDQLLGIVVLQERPELETEKNRLIVQKAEDERSLSELEDKILFVLSSSKGNILEDETAINVLNSSKKLSNEIQEKRKIAIETELAIDSAREKYQPVAKRAQILFFCIADLATVDPMYQYSLNWFVNLFITSIEKSPKSNAIESRLESLNQYFTYALYANVCRSLFEKDKLLFSFLLTIAIRRGDSAINEAEWYFLLTGGVAMENPYPNPDSEWLGNIEWGEVCRLSQLHDFADLRDHFIFAPHEWKNIFDSDTPHTVPFPHIWQSKLNSFQKLCIIRCIRRDKLAVAIREYVKETSGDEYTSPPPFDLQACYNDSSQVTPLIFVLSPGSDPMNSLAKYAAEIGKTLYTISLGQGQGANAMLLINKARSKGEWVVLQNCHLAVSWLPELEKICEEMKMDNSHEHFRLWCTSYPSPSFPISILQNGIKMTNEPPKGMKANLNRSFVSDPISDYTFYNAVENDENWRRLLFGLCYFHAIIQERRQFGPLGWNVSYEFNDSDLRISVRQLAELVDKDVESGIPYIALRYLIGECNYGGRVTDDKDRRTLMSILYLYIQEGMLESEKLLSDDGVWKTPDVKCISHSSYVEHISKFPSVALPEVYGLHQNADITKNNKESRDLLGSVLTTQGSGGGGGGGNKETLVSEVAKEILNKLPSNYDIEAAVRSYPVIWAESMNTVLVQELMRFNKLTSVIRSSLYSCLNAMKGLTVMTKELEEACNAIFFGSIPGSWKKASYPSLKPLGMYFSDLLDRLLFFQKWVDEGPPPTYWISGFYFTQSFLTGALQNYARKYTIPIDKLFFDFEVLSGGKENYNTPASDGIYIYGMFLEGARWNAIDYYLDESKPKVLFSPAPVIWFKPIQNDKIQIKNYIEYNCPIYKTSERRGTLSTTGHSTNFVLWVKLPSKDHEDHWIRRGVALLLSPDI